MSVFDVFEQLEATPGKNDKIAILEANKNDKELIELLDAALNFDRKFYVKKFNMPKSLSIAAGHSHQYFMELLNYLETRAITGNAALGMVELSFSSFTPQEQKWYSRILLKDLKCGFGISSCKKAGIDIHEFEVMLAKDGKEFKKLDELIAKGVYASPKLNGYRVLAICDMGVVSLCSRNGLEYDNFPDVVATLEKLCQNTSFILDGEIMSDDFNKMQQTAMSSKSKKSVGDIKYHVFGWVPFNEWKTQDFKMLTKERLVCRDSWFMVHAAALATDNNIVSVDYKIITNTADMFEFEKECIAKGYEGAMGLPNIPYYVGKKSNKLFKFKTFETWDCEVLSVYEGTGKNVGKMGGLMVLQENGKECGLGTGWDDDDREYIFAHPNEFIGKYIEVRYQELTPDGVMQFPSVVRWRTDK